MSFLSKLFSKTNTESNGQWTEYNSLRDKKHHYTACEAPFNNMYFSWEGKVIACCFNQRFVLGRYPQQSISEIWNGSKAEELRTSVKNYDLNKGCEGCSKQMLSDNPKASNSLRFDNTGTSKYPTMMEFQLTNTCNLECVMCNGYLSSAIRANRENLPKLPSLYDEEFVNQLEEFIPFLRETTFSGGEPFLIKTYYEIWKKCGSLNPELNIKVITNGTIYNDRVQDVLAKNNFHITISLDSPVKETYEKIRIGANFEEVIQNAIKFNEYCRSKGTLFNFNFCPMVNNWREIPLLLELCDKMKASFYFSIVYLPASKSMQSLSEDELQEAIILLSELSENQPQNGKWQKNNTVQIKSLLSVLRGWQFKHVKNNDTTYITITDVWEAIEKKIKELEHSENSHECALFLEKYSKLITPEYVNETNIHAIYNFTPKLTTDIVKMVSDYTMDELRQRFKTNFE